MPTWRLKASEITAFAARLFFAATVILIPFRARQILLARPMPTLYRDYTDFLLFAADTALIFTLGSWIVSLCLLPRSVSLGPRHLWIPMVALTMAGSVSAFTSVDPPFSGYQGIRLVALFWFYLFIVNEIRGLRWVIAPVALQAAVQSIVALAQFIAQRSVDLQRLGELYLDPAWAGISIVVAHGVRLMRAYGLTDHPNILGGCLAFALVLLLALARPTRGRMIALAGLLPALLVTFSRGAWIAFLGSAVFLALILIARLGWAGLRRRSGFAMAGLFLMAPFLLAYARFFGARLNADQSFTTPSVEQQAIGERLLLFNSALPILLSHPVVGVGVGASPAALHLAYPDFPVPVEPPHFALFDAALETGMLGGLSYLALTVAPFVVFYLQRRTLLTNPVACAALAVLLCIAIVGFFDYYTWLLVPGRMWQWFAWGLWGSASQGKLQSSAA